MPRRFHSFETEAAIIAAKGSVTCDILAERHGISRNTVISMWRRSRERAARGTSDITRRSPMASLKAEAAALSADLATTRVELAALRRENDELRMALEPFAARAVHVEPDWLDNECHWHPAVGSPITVGDLRRAARTFAETGR